MIREVWDRLSADPAKYLGLASTSGLLVSTIYYAGYFSATDYRYILLLGAKDLIISSIFFGGFLFGIVCGVVSAYADRVLDRTPEHVIRDFRSDPINGSLSILERIISHAINKVGYFGILLPVLPLMILVYTFPSQLIIVYVGLVTFIALVLLKRTAEHNIYFGIVVSLLAAVSVVFFAGRASGAVNSRTSDNSFMTVNGGSTESCTMYFISSSIVLCAGDNAMYITSPEGLKFWAQPQ